MDFGILASHIKSDEQTYSFSKPVTVKIKGEDKTYSSYTLTKIVANAEKKIVNFFTQNKKGTVYDILAGSITRLDDKEITRFETVELLRQIPQYRVEEIFLNLRVLTYGSLIKVTFNCKNMVNSKDSNGRYERDEVGKILLTECGQKNTAEVQIDDTFIKTDEEMENSVEVKKIVTLPLNGENTAKVFVKPSFNTEAESVLANIIPKKQRDHYALELNLLSMIEKIETNVNDVLEILSPTISDFFTKDNTFDPTSKKAKEFISFFNAISLDVRDEIKDVSVGIREANTSYNIEYTSVCKYCKKEHKGKVAILDPIFLLPAWGK